MHLVSACQQPHLTNVQAPSQYYNFPLRGNSFKSAPLKLIDEKLYFFNGYCYKYELFLIQMSYFYIF